MPPAPSVRFPLRITGADATRAESIEDFALDLRRELADLDVTRVDRAPGPPAPAGARGLEHIAVLDFIITAVQAGESLAKVIEALQKLAARYRKRGQAVRLTVADTSSDTDSDSGSDTGADTGSDSVDLATAPPAEVAAVVSRLLAMPGWSHPGSRSALIIANAQYDDPTLAQLRSPGHDADALVRVLGDPAIGGFDAQALIDADERTIRRRVASFFAGRDRDDVLLLHFSCHGIKDERGRLYLAARDTDLALLGATAIPAGFVNDLLAGTQSQRVVLVLDCCYSGAFVRGAAARADEGVQIADEFGAGSGRIVLTASSATEYSFEDGELTRSQGRPSAFTGAVVAGLETGRADLDGDGEISVDELYDFTYRTVRESTPGQAPRKWTFGLEGSLVIARSVRPATLPVSIGDDLSSDRVVLRLEGVAALAQLLSSSKVGLRAAADAALRELVADDDSARVRQRAAEALATAGAVRMAPEPVESTRPGPVLLPVADPEPMREPEPMRQREPMGEPVVVAERDPLPEPVPMTEPDPEPDAVLAPLPSPPPSTPSEAEPAPVPKPVVGPEPVVDSKPGGDLDAGVGSESGVEAQPPDPAVPAPSVSASPGPARPSTATPPASPAAPSKPPAPKSTAGVMSTAPTRPAGAPKATAPAQRNVAPGTKSATATPTAAAAAPAKSGTAQTATGNTATANTAPGTTATAKTGAATRPAAGGSAGVMGRSTSPSRPSAWPGGRIGALGLASVVLAGISVILYVLTIHAAGGEVFGPTTWYTNLDMCLTVALIVLFALTRNIRWVAVLCGLIAWQWLYPTYFADHELIDVTVRISLEFLAANLFALLAQVAANAALLLSGARARVSSTGVRVGGAVALLAVALPLSLIVANALAYFTADAEPVRVLLALWCAAVVPVIAIAAPAQMRSALVAGWLFGGAQLALTDTATIYIDRPEFSFKSVPWMWALLVIAAVVMTVVVRALRVDRLALTRPPVSHDAPTPAGE